MKLTSAEIREKYLKFFEERGHKIVPSSSLIPENDPTTLFTGSGMQPMVPYLLGEKHPSGTRIVDSQKCFRAGDIEEVGDNTHTTFFEMLGNWSLGDYFKEEQIPWMFEFLVKKIGLDPNKLYFSVYKGTKEIGIGRDDTAEKLWKEQFKNVGVDAKSVDDVEENGMQGGRIFFYDEKENWWSRAGVPNKMPNGEPGGPDSEMFWDFGADLELHEKSEWKETHCNPACDCGRFLEIGNNVFMQYKKTAEGFLELENKNIDFGGGLERIAVALSDNPDVYMGDLFDGIRNKIEELTGKKYGENTNETLAFRVVMDHVRAATFLIGDGAVPSNKDQGYFTRRLIRRAIRFASHLGVEGGFIEKVASEVVDGYSSHYTDLAEKKAFILSEMEGEEKQFLSTLDKGLKEFDKLLKGFEIAFERSGKKIDTIAGPKAFKLYDTYGFPLEMTVELANEKGLKVDETGFAKAFEEHQAKSRAGAEQKFKGGLADDSTATTELHSATHLLLAGLNHVLGGDIHQKGSNITAERLRFDFNHDGKVERDILDKVEEFVNEAIQSGTKVTLTEMDKQKAMDEGVEGSFWEKYPDTVKVYSMVGNNGRTYSKELCGGPHVEATSDMGRFKIKKEEASSRGIRRIKAVLIKD
ncbi:alanine--tRNA ligase [Candidatus Gracilibacteria bacterium 28_42_T64]|nr:alanine--tRNA ligase [Candidatus Gracilibacteria bacterium 28_42_T64]